MAWIKAKLGAVVVWFEQRRWATVLLVGIAAGPPLLPGIAPYVESLDKLFKKSALVTLLIGVGWSVFVGAITAAAIALRPASKAGSVSELLQLLECLKQIVGEKVRRFELFLQKERGASPEKVFTEITQPDQQIAHIVSGIYQYFTGTLSTEDRADRVQIRVALARMGRRYIEGWESYYPSHEKPRSLLSSLQKPTAAFSRAKASGKMIIIESTKKELGRPSAKRRFEVSDESRCDEDGAMICYPIVLKGTRETPFVLSICASKPGFFRQSQQEVYRSILENFEQRIVLEYCLQEIKRTTAPGVPTP